MAEPKGDTENPTLSNAIGSATNYTRWIVSRFAPHMGESVLEVGLGEGNYVSHLPPFSRYVGVDLEEATVLELRRRMPDRDLRIGDVTDPEFPARVADSPFDTVVCCNVIEHVEDDALAVRNLLACLKPGGRLFLFVPAFEALYNDMDRLAGHLRRYTRARLRQAIPTNGTSILELRYFNPVGGLGWWLQKFSSVDDLNAPEVEQKIVLFDKYGVPMSRAVDPVTRFFFGQSVYALIKKHT